MAEDLVTLRSAIVSSVNFSNSAHPPFLPDSSSSTDRFLPPPPYQEDATEKAETGEQVRPRNFLSSAAHLVSRLGLRTFCPSLPTWFCPRLPTWFFSEAAQCPVPTPVLPVASLTDTALWFYSRYSNC